MVFAMAGREGIDTFVEVVAFQPNGCDLGRELFYNLLIRKSYFYCSTGVFLRHPIERTNGESQTDEDEEGVIS